MFPLMMIYLVLVLIRPQDYPALTDAIPFPLQQIVLLLAAVTWLLSSRRMVSAPQNLLIGLFLVAMMLSVAVNGWISGALPVMRDFAPVALAFFLFANTAFTRSRVTATMAVFVLCACVLVLHGIGQVQTGLGWTEVGLSQGTRIQYVGIFNDPNDLGLLFVTCFPMAVYLSSKGGLMGLRWLFWTAAAGLLVYGIYLTDSRGTVLALLLVFGVYVWMTRGLFIAASLGAIGLAVLMVLPSRMQELEVGEESAMDRVYSWYEGLHMFLAEPLLGVGKGAYTELYQLTAHNSIVLVLAEMGMVGLTLWLAFVGYCFWMTRKILDWRPPSGDAPPGAGGFDPQLLGEWAEDRKITVALLLSLSGFMVAAFFLSRTYVVTLYLLGGLVVAHYSYMRSRYGVLPEFRLADNLLLWPAISMAVAVAMYILVRILLVLA